MEIVFLLAAGSDVQAAFNRFEEYQLGTLVSLKHTPSESQSLKRIAEEYGTEIGDQKTGPTARRV